MRNEQTENQIVLRGTVAAPPAFSHESHGTRYSFFPLTVARLSGTEDRLNVLAGSSLLRECPLEEGCAVEATGQVRSFNNRGGKGSRLVITVFARTLTPADGEPANELVLAGTLCKAPILRRTPLGRDICDLLLAVNRPYGRADYLPCIAWGSLAVRCGARLVGDGVRLTGRLQSRVYNKVEDGVSHARTAFEVSILTLEDVR